MPLFSDLYPLLHALVVALLLPPGGPLLMLALGLLLALRWRRLGLGLAWSGALLAGLCSSVAGAALLQRLLLEPVPPLPHWPRADPDTAIVVLGGGIQDWSPEYGAPQPKPLTLERLRYAIRLARISGLPLLISGGHSPGRQPPLPTEATLMDQVAREDFGYSARWLEQQSADTASNARYTTAMLKPLGLRRIVLVTHEQHMPRAVRAFRASWGPDLELLPAPVGVVAGPGSRWLHWLPSERGIQQARYVAYERLALWAGH